jgi:hypothetical protein
MTKYWFGLLVVLGVSLTCLSQSPAAGQSAQANDAQCESEMQAYQSQRTACADFNEQLSYLKIQMAGLQNQRAALLKECQERPNSQACRDLSDLSAGRLSILEQDYNNLAQRGCPQPATPAQLVHSCRTGAGANTSNQAKPSAPPAQSRKPGSSPPAPPSSEHRQPPANSGPQAQPRMSEPQSLSPGQSARASGETRMTGSAGISGGSPSNGGNSAPAPSSSAASTGAQRPK